MDDTVAAREKDEHAHQLRKKRDGGIVFHQDEADCDACDERKDRHGDECQRQIQFDHTDHCHHDTDQAF